MGFPKMYDDVHLPFLHLVHKYPIKSVKEAVGILAHYFNLTNEELNERVNCGRKKFYSMVSFSLKRLMDAGLIFREVKPFRATDKARKLLARKPNKITNHDLNVLIKRKPTVKLQKQEYDEYLEKIRNINETEFEHLSGLVLSKIYNVDFVKQVEITPPCNDGGIDGIVHLGEESKIYFESKIKGIYYSVGEPLLRNFTGALVIRNGRTGYYFITTRFTSEAIRFVEALKIADVKVNITLIDGHKLVELIFKYGLQGKLELD
ncbi:hypothetical protein CN442_00775 [Bacillus thuringiensis]|uniref:restriction endonuclease n=1 Tax=Bacillus thuringiensis TaxID=1428 RepID=UPI000BF54B5B|nr:restriction endonuclease [Bacillus thuringiensis]PEV93976.1 hypothetical protein CN442_00775 [Bacillus thuringiensis]